MIPQVDEENKFYEDQKVCSICKKGFSIDNDKKHHEVRDYFITHENLEELLIAFGI